MDSKHQTFPLTSPSLVNSNPPSQLADTLTIPQKAHPAHSLSSSPSPVSSTSTKIGASSHAHPALYDRILFLVPKTDHSKYKSWALLWLLPCTSIIFTAGFICREYDAFHPQDDSATQGLLFSGV
jgi:hypothetical protein